MEFKATLPADLFNGNMIVKAIILADNLCPIVFSISLDTLSDFGDNIYLDIRKLQVIKELKTSYFA